MFTRKRKDIRDPIIFINNTKLEVVKEYKYLGVILDNKLTWKANTEYLVSKANKNELLLNIFK